jgi:hypothetical protein
VAAQHPATAETAASPDPGHLQVPPRGQWRDHRQVINGTIWKDATSWRADRFRGRRRNRVDRPGDL